MLKKMRLGVYGEKQFFIRIISIFRKSCDILAGCNKNGDMVSFLKQFRCRNSD